MTTRDIVLDKTSDGKYWTLTGWADDETAIRLRLAHFTFMEPSDVWPEVRIPGRDGAATWEAAGSQFMFALGSPDFEPEQEWAAEFAEVWRQQFIALARELCWLSRRMDLGAATGETRPIE